MPGEPHVFLSDEPGAYGVPAGDPLSIGRFHRPEYAERVIAASRKGTGYLDNGATPGGP